MFLFRYTKEALKFLMQLFNPLCEENIPVNELFCQSLPLQEFWQGSDTDAGHWNCLFFFFLSFFFSCLKTFFPPFAVEIRSLTKAAFQYKGICLLHKFFPLFIKKLRTLKSVKSGVEIKYSLRKKMFSLEILMIL